MIKGITQTGRYTFVSGGTTSTPYISPGTAGAGMLRWNPNMNQMEVNDGNSWKTIDTSYASVGLTPEAESLLDWAKKKMQEEQELFVLSEKNEAVRIALENLNKAKEQLTITAHLAREDDKERTS